MEKRHLSKMRKRRRLRRLLNVLLFLFLTGCIGIAAYKKLPEYLSDTKKIEDKVRDTLLDVPLEVQELREKEISEGSSECYEYYYAQLEETEKRIYRELLEGIKARQTEIYLSVSDSEMISKAYRAIGLDHCELFWMHSYETAYQTLYQTADYCVFEVTNIYSDEEIAEILEAMEAAWQEVNRMLEEGASSYEKVQAVYTYLIETIEYVESEHDQNLAGAFWKKECVCAGYTRAAQYLLNRMEIPCIFVSGKTLDDGISHSWNVVEIDDSYYYMDVTNGDQTKFLEGDATELAEHKTIMYDYLCPFPKEYEAMFQADKEFVLPECTEDYKNFYKMNLGLFDTYDRQKIYEYCCMRLDYGAAVIRFKFGNAEAFEAACEEWEEGDAVQDVAQYYMKKYNMWQTAYHIGVLEQFYTMYIMF